MTINERWIEAEQQYWTKELKQKFVEFAEWIAESHIYTTNGNWFMPFTKDKSKDLTTEELFDLWIEEQNKK